jgi:hypothetical protein
VFVFWSVLSVESGLERVSADEIDQGEMADAETAAVPMVS